MSFTVKGPGKPIFVILFFLIRGTVFSQPSNGLTFPSVNNQFLGAAGGSLTGTSQVDVDQYTGALEVNIPICQVGGRELTIPVSLYYSGGQGIRVQDYASFLGLGWQLNAGGGISRVVRTFPDEQSNGYLGTGLWGQKVASALENNTALPGNFTSSPPTADGEPDIFYVKTPFFSFQFTFDENGNAVFSNNTGLKIIPSNLFNTTNTGNSYFEVIDDKGTQYFFGSSTASIETTTTSIYGTSYTFPTTWYLDHMITFNSKDTVTLNYLAAPNADNTYHYEGTYEADDYGEQYYDTTHPVQNTVASKYVSSIVTRLGEADFAYAFDRQDDANAARLTTITVNAFSPQQQTNSTTLNTYSFNYGYFGSTVSTDPNVLRLQLTNITVAGNTPATSTPLVMRSFGYNTTNTMPTRKSLAVADFWGYLCWIPGMPLTNFPSNNRTPNQTAAQTDILTSIQELTGDTWNIAYQLNDYFNSSGGTNTQVGGLRVSQLSQTLPTAQNMYTNYLYADSSGHSTGQIFSNGYTIIGFTWGNPVVVEEIMSESPSEFYDLNGNFTGYSSVTAVNQNGGYTVTKYSNFSDFPDIENYLNTANASVLPDITSSISLVYKRGLPEDKSVYTSTGVKIAEDLSPLNYYTSLTLPVVKKSWAYKWNTVGYALPSMSGSSSCSSIYYSNYENYRMTKMAHRDYDQITPANYVQTASSLGYSPANLRLVQADTTIDSKGNRHIQTMYHADDAGIPLVTSSEQTALTQMISSNNTNRVIHQTDSRNGVIHQTHNAYGAVSYGLINNVYLAHSDSYMGSSLAVQQFFSYDPSTSNLVSQNMTGGVSTSYLYGYHASIPIAKISNAVNTYTVNTGTQSLNGTLSMSAPTGSTATSFTQTSAGPIVLTIDPNPGTTYSLYYNLTGPASYSGTLCASRSSTTCSYPSTVTYSSLPAGTYSLFIELSTGSSSYMAMTYSYTGTVVSTSVTPGFFYEGFEENPLAATGNAHSGNCYYDGTVYGNYTANFTIPDSRSYIIQWWKWNSGTGIWTFNQQAYTGSMSLPGIIDDVRVFPTNALLSTYSYNPFVGKTGEVTPNGRTTTYEYDGLSRQAVTRDDNKNIASRTCYSYAGQSISCPSVTVYSNAALSQAFTRNNCGTGYQASSVTYTVAAGIYTSDISQNAANQQAADDVRLNGQNYANANGTCSLLYYNVAESGTYTRNNCGSGYTAGTATYTVPANTYSSTVSQAAANQLAINDVNANGQNYANTYGTCTPIITPVYGSLTLTGGSASVTFTTTTVANIVLSINPNPGTTYSLAYTLTGPTSTSGTQCASRSSVTCSWPSSATITNAPVGTYTLSIRLASGTSSSMSMSYNYN
jgi:YD repeat-containing protein